MNWMINAPTQMPPPLAARMRAHADEVVANYEVIIMDRAGNPVPMDRFLDELIPAPQPGGQVAPLIAAVMVLVATLLGALVAYGMARGG